MKEIVKILMERDDMSREDALGLVEETRELILECDGSYTAACDVLADQLGLEPDYLMDFLM